MEAKATKLLKLIGQSEDLQFVIPVYQRMYSWDIRHCKQLWEDILKVGESKRYAHFIGSIVYVADGVYGTNNSLLVIDGQQRLTTITLLLIALRDCLENREILEKFSYKKIHNRYLINSDEVGEKQYRLVLSENDKDTLIALVDKDKIPPKEASIKIQENFHFFQQELQKLQDDDRKLEVVCRGIEKLMIVCVSLERDKDNPQLIFESMNSTGKDLSQADLIRNYILMGLEPKLQTRLYEKYWYAMEQDFGQENYERMFNAFVRHYLTIKTGDIPNINKVYESFKEYHQDNNIEIEILLEDMKKYCEYFCAIALKKEQDCELKNAFCNLLELQNDTTYPLLLTLYEDYATDKLSKDDFKEIVSLIESYIFRRAICEIPTNSLNKTFASFAKFIDKNAYLQSVKAHFLLLKSYTRFPSNEEFKNALEDKNIYHFSKKSYLLTRLENYKRKEKISTNEYTIEHIMPQNPNLSKEWQSDLGENYKEIQEKYLHTLGNLTLTGYNSEYKDKPFKEKRDMQGGFKQSPLKLNDGLRGLQTWNQETIEKRAEDLANKALEIWAMPTLEQALLDSYKQEMQNKSKKEYSLENYNFSQTTKEIFKALHKDIVALDENITQSYTKLYIAYKLETNIVDIVPQKSKLKLYLNIPFNELIDEKRMARNVANIGSWGNGDVEVSIESAQDIAYCLGLIRQALERQL